MARGKNSAQSPKKANVEYINIDLRGSHRQDLIKWVETCEPLTDMLEKVANSGLKIGISFDNYNECFQASITQLPGVDDNGPTLVLIGRGGNIVQALQALLFKYFIVLEEELEDSDMRNQRGETDWS